MSLSELLSQLCRPPPGRADRMTVNLGEIFWPVQRAANRAVELWPEFFRKLPQ